MTKRTTRHTTAHAYPLLDVIQGTQDVQRTPKEKLKQLSDEVRCFLIDTVSRVGGHFGSNLGVVELTVALHYVYNPEKDRLIWDVGHQTYAHKVLTGRKDKLHTIRKKGGLAPFPRRSESTSDAFGVGHASTSISAAIGMAIAHADEENPPHVVAVIGDGALTGGMAFEGLDHAGDVNADILVIVNDNKMSISPNVGAMTRYLTRLISSTEYTHIRAKGKKMLERVPPVDLLARRMERHAKGMVTPSTIFEEMGFQYYGPVDGNDVDALVAILENLKHMKGPRLLHVATTKGKGCVHAENDALALHAVTAFDPKTGKKQGGGDSGVPYTSVFSSWIVEKARADVNLHAITPAMLTGSGLVAFNEAYPDRFHDVGIAEQHAVTLAAGMACEGKKPVVAIYSTFLQRAYDQLIHDVAIQDLDVLFAIDRAGVVGPDGDTHAGSFDLSFLRCVPNVVLMTPASAEECTAMLDFGYAHKGPAAVRYPRANTTEQVSTQLQPIVLGESVTVRSGTRIAILSFGALLDRCHTAADVLDATLINMRFVKPLDEKVLHSLAHTHDYFVTVEDNAVIGGAGSAVNDVVTTHDLPVKVRNIGLPDRFLPHGTRDEVLEDAGLSVESIVQFLKGLS